MNILKVQMQMMQCNANMNDAMQIWMMQCNAWLLFYPHVPTRGSEGCNHNARQCALLYRYLAHQFGYSFFKCISTEGVQKYECCNVAFHFLYFITLH
jgi:hypothetical protein